MSDYKDKVQGLPWRHSPWHVEEADDAVRDADGHLVCAVATSAHAQLIAEAGTVLHETGLTSRELAALVDRLRLEAQVHAQEARTANATIAEIYQVCTGARGEPGNWNGAEPVRALVAQRDRLLAALKAMVSCWQSVCAGHGWDPDHVTEATDARAAIAYCEAAS